MTDPKTLVDALQREGNLVFAPNIQEARTLEGPLTQLQSRTVDGATLWFSGGAPTAETTRIKVYPTGHRVYYNSLGYRFLMTDPEGYTLHEVEWTHDPASEEVKLKHVRMQLDCQQWAGIRPRAKKFSNKINISSMSGWEQMTLNDLREGAAQSWQVPLSEVKYFYRDENFVSTGQGEYDVQLEKDGLYVLIDGDFENTVLMSFMFTLNWEKLETIPVVELFQSTLPGTGGAAFEFIWGLHQDQSRSTTLDPLRYRGLPTYPSQAAFNIFSAFFTPKGPEGEEIMDVFMDTDRSHEIEWTPRPKPPWRYFSDEHSLCLTVQNGFLYKVTELDDPVAVPYINTSRGAKGPCQRFLEVIGDSLILHDADQRREIPLDPQWNITVQETQPQKPADYPFGWRHFFGEDVPAVDPRKILFTVPLYPEGRAEIEESAVQPMVVDQILHYMENHDAMPEKLEKTEKVLVHTFDTVIAGCIDCTHERDHVVLYGDPEWAQKNAQELWNYAASRNQLEGVRKVKFLKEADHVDTAYRDTYDMIFKWIPFFYHTDRETCEKILQSVSDALKPGGILFLVAPHPLLGLFDHYRLTAHNHDAVVEMPFFQQHLKLCPENTLNPDITVFFAEKK